MKNLKGFTLTEVIIVLVILGALALILIPNFAKMMPDDHNIKYKKAFYTIQEIMNDITNDPSVCDGLNAAKTAVVADNVYLQSCGTNNFRAVIAERLSTMENIDVATIANASNANIRTTNGMRWYIPTGTFTSLFPNQASTQTIIVSLDDRAPNSNNANQPADPNPDNGIFRITIAANGKVFAGTQTANRNAGNTAYVEAEDNLLLDNPND